MIQAKYCFESSELRYSAPQLLDSQFVVFIFIISHCGEYKNNISEILNKTQYRLSSRFYIFVVSLVIIY